jgi:uncharacterized OB-fold protein
MSNRPTPVPSHWSEPYWKAARDGRLVYQSCPECGTATLYPKLVCPSCLGEQLTWLESAGTGEVYTYTEQVAGPPSGFEDLVPYVVAVVRLDEGVQLMTNIVGPGASGVHCGDRVEVGFHTVEGTETVLPVFSLVGETLRD